MVYTNYFGAAADWDISPSGLGKIQVKDFKKTIDAGEVHVIEVVCFPGYVTSRGACLQQHPKDREFFLLVVQISRG